MWVAADDEADPISGFRPLNIRTIDKKSGQNLGMLAIEDKPRKKRFGIILSNLDQEEQTDFEVQYRWPGYLKKSSKKAQQNSTGLMEQPRPTCTEVSSTSGCF